MNTARLGKINDILTIVVVLLGLYIAISPLLPAFTEWWQRENTIPTELTQAVESDKPLSKNSGIEGNRVSIPVMNLDESILEGSSEKTVNNGVWKLPDSADPGQGSNTVLVGHRYSYNPGIAHPFYSLDIVRVGDSIGVYWNDTLFRYVVTKVLVVSPDAVEIEAPTQEEQLTIYTCTPLWSSANRLVVIAKPIEENQ
jgi:sortase A